MNTNFEIYKESLFNNQYPTGDIVYLKLLYGKELINDKEKLYGLISSIFSGSKVKNTNDLSNDFLMTLYKLFLNNNTLLDFQQIPIIINERSFDLEKVLITTLNNSFISLVNITNITRCYEIDKDKTWELILRLNKKDYFEPNMIAQISKWYNLQDDNIKNKELLFSCRSFNTLLKFQEHGFNIWQIMEKNASPKITTLLPFYVSQCEAMRKDIIKVKKTDVIQRAKIIIDQKKLWENIKEVKENINAYKTKFAALIVSIVKEQEYRDFLKEVNIADKDLIPDLIDCNINNVNFTYKFKELLFSSTKLITLKKIIGKNEKLIDDDGKIAPLIKLLITEPLTSHVAQLKTTKKNFSKIWIDIIKETDFLEVRETMNLLDQLLVPSIKLKCYLPINPKFLENPDLEDYYYFKSLASKESDRVDSFLDVLHFFKSKSVNFQHENKNGLTFTKLINNLLSSNKESKIYGLFEENGLIREEFSKFSKDKKEQIWQSFVKDWKIIWNDNRLLEYKVSYINSGYQNPSSVVSAINMFSDLLFIESKKIEFWQEIKTDLTVFQNYNTKLNETIKKIDMISLSNDLNNRNADKKEKRSKI